jgi:5'-nucleotidase
MAHKEFRILLSNDDGIHAPGLKTLEKIARELSDDIWVVAPEVEQSGAAHSITLTRPLRLRKVSSRRYAVDGTPTDCMALAIMKLLRDKKPTLMLSGVNHGSNLGEDVTYSGTVAAAMEATLLGIPSIALSQTHDHDQPIKWGTAEAFAPEIIRNLLTAGWPRNVLININFPNLVKDSVKGVLLTRQGLRHHTHEELREWYDPVGKPYYWLLGALRELNWHDADSDLAQNRQGMITITPLHLDLTHYETLNHLKKHFQHDKNQENDHSIKDTKNDKK